MYGRHNGNVEIGSVVIFEVLIHFEDKITIVRTVTIQPENSGNLGGPCPTVIAKLERLSVGQKKTTQGG